MPSRYRAGLSPGHGSFSFSYSNGFFVCLDHFFKTEITNGWLAPPPGLDNIPTSDTTPQGTFVFQLFSTMGNDRDTDLNFGFKSGLDLGPVDFEFGTASHLVPDKSGPWSLHSKMAVPFGDGLPTVALGVVNVTFSEHASAGL